MKRWKWNCVLLFLAVTCALFFPGKSMAEESNGTLRVAIPLMNDSGFVTFEDGEFKGYYIDYLDEISKYTGWDYEYIPIESYEELNAVSESGEFDLMAGIVYGGEYDEQYFDYPRHSMGAKRYVLAVPKDFDRIPDREYTHLRGLRVGVSGPEDELMERCRDFCFMNGIECADDAGDYPMGINFVQIDPSGWRKSLADGTVDGILASDAFCIGADMYAMNTFGLDQIYFVVPNGRDDIRAKLDDAIGKIISFNPEYNDNLYEKYFHDMLHYQASFNDTEQEFLKRQHVCRVGLPSDMAPYAFRNEEGNADGLIIKVLEMVSERTDGVMQFKYVLYDKLEDVYKAVNIGECDIAGLSVYSDLVENRVMRRSMTFFRDEFKYYENVDWSGKDMPALEGGLLWPDPAGELYSVSQGNSAYTVQLSYIGAYYLNYFGYILHEYSVPDGEVLFCFGYGDSMEDTAISVIDKSLMVIEEEELENYVTGLCMFVNRELDIWDYLWRYRYTLILFLAVILAIICALLVITVINVTKNSEQVYRLLYHDDIVDGISYKKFMKDAAEYCGKPGKKLVLYINIAGFKYINDVFGYKKGNEVLKKVKEFLEDGDRDTLVARIYADRFVVLLSCPNLEVAKQYIWNRLNEFTVMTRKEFPAFNLWIKVGAYIMRPEDDIQNAVNLANYAVDEMDSKSDNDFIIYDEAMHDRVLTYKDIEKDMWRALEQKEFETFYQPKFDINSKKLIGAEALVRWNHPEKGLLSPGVFIPVFEKNHFIIQLDFYVFRCVCCFQRSRLDQGKELFSISSNFSRLHLEKEDFVDRLLKVTKEFGVPTNCLEIEITETIAMEEFGSLSVAVENLKKNGFQVSIDDFGSGYSSIQLLYKIPIDVLKLDKAFVDNPDVSEMEMELMDKIIAVSQKNRIKIICEGVETEEQESFVRQHNCNAVQGFLYSRPLPEGEFRQLLQ